MKDFKIFLKNKKKKAKKVGERYQNLTEEEKEKKHNKNLYEEQKQKLIESRRNYYLIDSK